MLYFTLTFLLAQYKFLCNNKMVVGPDQRVLNCSLHGFELFVWDFLLLQFKFKFNSLNYIIIMV